MAQAQTIYVTADGKKFDDQSDANAHEAHLKNKAEIEAFVVATGAKKAQATMAVNTIAAWEGYKATGVLPSPKPETPAPAATEGSAPATEAAASGDAAGSEGQPADADTSFAE